MFAAMLLTWTLTAAGCQWMSGGFLRATGPQAPVVMQPNATAQQIVAAVNQNTGRVRTYSTSTAKFSVPGMAALPILRGNIALERPHRFRLAANSIVGPEIDLGSNDQELWFWVKRNSSPALYFCRHDQFATSGARQMLPIDPTWIGDALGLVELDPNIPYQGPFPRADGSLELRATISTPTGPMERVVVVDPTRAWVLEQHLYDLSVAPNGASGIGINGAGRALVASALAKNFFYDPVAQVSLPRKVTIRVPRSDLALAIDVGQVIVNAPLGNPGQLWAMPTTKPRVDLGTTSPNLVMGTSPISPTQPIPTRPLSRLSQPILSQPIQAVQYQPNASPVINRLPVGGVAIEANSL